MMLRNEIIWFVPAATLLLSACEKTYKERTVDTTMNNPTSQSVLSEIAAETGQKLLGGLDPEAALEYMKNTPNIVIVQVNTAYWKINPGFTGAMWIPHDEMAERYDEIPEGRPVILHCGAEVVSVPAYETLIEKRPDIPELSYVAGSPHAIMEEYNKWLESQ
ncbi:MAG: hypothetical protein NC452_17045 [Eubacterium sp.]|nr:hypothetical protein [Eubacterium sp.]